MTGDNADHDIRLQKIEQDLHRLTLNLPNLFLLMDRIVESELAFHELQRGQRLIVERLKHATMTSRLVKALLKDENIRESIFEAVSKISKSHKDQINKFILDGLYDRIQKIVGKRVIAMGISVMGLIIVLMWMIFKYVLKVGS